MNDKLSIVIVDDQRDSRDVLNNLLAQHEQFEVVGTAKNAEEGLNEILEKLPDVIFLDINMPGQNGLEMFDELKSSGYVSNVVFTTGDDDYAIQAVRKRAFDYLLKPINPDELDACLQRLRISIKKGHNDVQRLSETRWTPSRIKFNTRSGFVLIDPNEIVYCMADGNFTQIFYNENDRELVTVQLGRMEPILMQTSLKRIGRSYIINTNYVKEINRKKEFCRFQKDGSSFNIRLSVNYLKLLDELL